MRKHLLLSLVAALACVPAITQAQTIEFAPTVTEIETSPGATFDLSLDLTNTVQCTAFQWAIAKTDDFEVAHNDAAGTYMVDFGSRLTANYDVSAEYTTTSKDFLVLASNHTSKKLMPLGTGPFCTITFIVPDERQLGDYELHVTGAAFGWTGGAGCRPADTTVKVKVLSSGIEGVQADLRPATGQMYDITGRPVDTPAPGFYIIDGQKVLIKK